MRLSLDLRYRAEPEVVARAYADPALYAAFAGLPRADRPDVLSSEVDGHVVELQVRWRFSAPLSPAARRVIDPARLTWVEVSRHDLSALRVTFRMLPDNYADRFSCHGSYAFRPAPAASGGTGSTIRAIEGDLRVKAPIVGRAVEAAIVSGLEDQLRSEIAVVESFVG